MTGLGSQTGAILDAETIEIDRIQLQYEAKSYEESQGNLVQKINASNETSVRISCELDEICLEVDDSFLEKHKIRDRSKLHLADPTCRGNQLTAEGKGNVWRWCTRRGKAGSTALPNFDCATQSQINSTHLVYKNSLTRNIQPGDIIVGTDSLRTLNMPFGCAWPLNVFVSTSHESDFEIHDTIVVESDVAGVGKYEAKMFLYQDEKFSDKLEETPVLEIDDNVFIGVELINAELGVNVVVEKAWATPLPSPYHSPIQIPIVDQGCPSLETVEELDVQLFANGESGLSTFSTSVFKFADYESAYLHAEVKICFTEKDTCPKKGIMCGNATRLTVSSTDRLSRSTDEENVVSIGPIIFKSNDETHLSEFIEEEILIQKPTYENGAFGSLGKTDVLIAILLAFVILLSMVVVTLYVRWRRATRGLSTRRKVHLNQVVTVTR